MEGQLKRVIDRIGPIVNVRLNIARIQVRSDRNSGDPAKSLASICSQNWDPTEKHGKYLYFSPPKLPSKLAGPRHLNLISNCGSIRRILFQNNFAKYETFFPSCHVEAEVKESGNEESEVEMADRASGLIHGGSFRSSK